MPVAPTLTGWVALPAPPGPGHAWDYEVEASISSGMGARQRGTAPSSAAPADPAAPVGAGAAASAATAAAPPGRAGAAPAADRPQPRRGSVMSPPPAWEPDEVTLGFAMVADETGSLHDLAEPVVLATIFIAAETERRRLLGRLSGASEEIEAIANLYWPLLVLPGPTAPDVAIFDGTGVWNRTFRYTLLPPVDRVEALLDRRPPLPECLAQLRALMPYFAHDPGAEVLTVSGFLPVDPPLLFDVLSHSELRSDPQSPHAGFLPARHESAWYEEIVRQMRAWLDRFAKDLGTLGRLRDSIQALLTDSLSTLDAEYARAQEEAKRRSDEATARSDAEVTEIRRRHAEEMRPHFEELRRAHSLIAHSETSVATAEALALRAHHRRADAGTQQARSKQAELHLRTAHRQIAERRRAVEALSARERGEIERALASVAEVEREGARRLAEIELFRDEFVAAGTDLVQAIDGQLAARTSQRNLLAGYFIPLPPLAQVRVIWFPLWTVVLRGPRGTRQLLFPPMRVRAGAGLTGSLRKLFGGVVLPLEPRTEQFDTVLRSTMEDALVADPWLASAALALARAADLLVDPDAQRRLRQGLEDLQRAGWVSGKQVQEYLTVFQERLERRAAVPSALPAPPPAPERGDPSPGPKSPG